MACLRTVKPSGDHELVVADMQVALVPICVVSRRVPADDRGSGERVAQLRRPGSDAVLPDREERTGLDHYQVRRYDAWHRHINLAVTAAHAPKAQGAWCASHQRIRRLLAHLTSGVTRPLGFTLYWSRHRRQQQTQARSSHHERRWLKTVVLGRAESSDRGSGVPQEHPDLGDLAVFNGKPLQRSHLNRLRTSPRKGNRGDDL
jgi:hypothetical protein